MKRPRGFTLIEVLVALLIVALGMGALLGSLTSAADNTLRLREKSLAEWVGLNQLSLTRLSSAPVVTGQREGDAEFADGHWHWQQQVSAMEIPGVLRIVIQVRRSDEPGGGAAAAASPDWLATVTGFRGDALRSPSGTLGIWDNPNRPQGPGNRNSGPPAPATPATSAPAPATPAPLQAPPP